MQLEDDAAFMGELSLEGLLRPVTGVLPMALAARRLGIRKLYLPADNAAEATLAEGLEVYPVESVGQLVAHLSGGTPMAQAPAYEPPQPDYAGTGLSGRPGAGERQARHGGGGRRGTQRPAGGPAGQRQEYAGPPPARPSCRT